MIEFDPDGHIYRLDGRVVPSVTQVLQPYTSLDFVDQETLRRTAEFGTHVHEACHLHDCETLDRDALDPELLPYLEGWQNFLADTGATVIASEYRVASKVHNYAGTLDKIVYWGKSQRMLDLKSGTVVPATVGPQVAAYAEAHAEECGTKIRDRYCLHLPGGGKYKLHKLADPRDWTYFKSALNLHHWFYAKRKAA